MVENITQRTIHGLKWSYISTISTAIMQIGYTAVMARLLNPSDFGLVAMSGVVLRFGQYFAQMGMGSAIIQKKELNKANISAAFTSSIILGLLFTILTFFLAPLAKYVFNNIEVVPIVKVMGLSFLINGFSLTALALIRRSLDFKNLAFAEITAYIIGYLFVGIGSALLGNGVWSLVYASLSQSLILALLTFLIIRHKVTLSFSWADYKPLLSFGSKVSIISFLEFIGSSLDTILIGRFFGDQKLGFYNRAQMLINLPMTYLITSFSKVLFPSLSIIQDDNERIKRNMFVILKMAAIIILPFAAVVSILSKEIVFVLLGTKWMESVNLLHILAFAGAINFLEHLITVLFEAKEFLKEKIYVQTSYIFVLLTAYYLLFSLGVKGFAIGLLCSLIVKFVVYSSIFLNKMNIKLIEFLKVFTAPFLSTVIILCLLIPFHSLFNLLNINLYVKFLVSIIFTIILYIFVLFFKFNADIKYNIFALLMIILKKKNGHSFASKWQ